MYLQAARPVAIESLVVCDALLTIAGKPPKGQLLGGAAKALLCLLQHL